MLGENKKNVTISISTSTIIKVVFVIGALFFLWMIRDILAIVFVAIILAALIDPLADWFEKHRIPRALSVIVIYVLLIALVGLVLFLLIPPIVEEFGQLAQNFGGYWESVTAGLKDFKVFSIDQGFSSSLEAGVQSIGDNFSSAIGKIFGTITGLIGGVIATILVLVITFYMVVEEETARRAYRSLAPPKYQPYISQLTGRMKKKIGGWLRGEIILALIVGTLVFIALKILGVNYALLLAIFAGMAEFVPYLGPVLGGIPAVFIAFAQSPIKALLVLAVFVLIQQLENHLIYPKVMQKAVGLNPVVSIIALLIGAKIGGVVGALLAIPVATVINVFVQDLIQHWGNGQKSSEKNA